MNVYRKRYSAPIPSDAERTTITVKKKPCPAVRVKDGEGRAVVYPLNSAGTKMRIPSPCWYGKVGGKDVKLFTNREASKSRLRELIEKHERGQTSLRVADSSGSALAGHLKDWRAHLEAKESKAKHVNQFVGAVRRVIDACGFSTPADMRLDDVLRHLADLKRERPMPTLAEDKTQYTRAELAELLGVGVQAVTNQVTRYGLAAVGNGKARVYPRTTAARLLAIKGQGASPKTVREYVAALRSFCRWLVEEERVHRNPLAKPKPGKGRSGDRHRRRPLTRAELRRLLLATRPSPAVRRGLSGEDRFWLYAVAVSTGFRAAELASLTPRSFDLDAQRPVVHLQPQHSKNGRGAEQPLPASLLAGLRVYLALKSPHRPVWPGTWTEKPVEILRPDLAAAAVPFSINGANGVPLYADMHSFRHTFIRMLDQAGTSLKEAMQLARHSDPKLTMAVYGQASAEDLAAKVDAIGIDCFPSASPVLPQPRDSD